MKRYLFLVPILAITVLSGCNKKQQPSNSDQSSISESSDSNSYGSSQGGNTSSSSSQGGSQSSEVPSDYYASITEDMVGTTLLNALNTLNKAKRKKTIGYKQHRNYYKYTERLPETPEGKMYGFYDNALVSSSWDNQATWNHEHVWPNSLGGGSVDDDIHMPRPTSVKINSSRGNKYYAANGAYDPGEYVEEYRGVAARIIFYCAIANTNLKIIDANSGGSNQMGKLSDLLKWNLEYMPTNDPNADVSLRVEQVRNEAIYSRSDLQGNRNPFIDHPEYACKIWGNTNSTTKSICGLN